MKFITFLVTAFSLSPLSAFNIIPNPIIGQRTKNINHSMSSSALQSSTKPIAIMVDAEIKPDRLDEFLDIIEKDAIGSRSEPGCIRFGELVKSKVWVCSDLLESFCVECVRCFLS